jgi:oligopeptide transport system substrate-binding protein
MGRVRTREAAVVAAVLLGLGAALAGCDSSRSGAGSAGATPGGGQRTVLRLAQTAEPTTLDPAQVEDGPTIEFLMSVFDGLVQWTTENKLAPALAEKWDVTNGGKTYVFHLRPGVKFHNGRELKAQDFLYSLTRSLSKPVRSRTAMVYLNDIVGAREFNQGSASTVKGLEAPDDRTFKITIDAPKAYFLAKLTYPTAYAVCKEAIESEKGTVTETSMVGTGAFKLSEYRRGDRIVLKANRDYWEGAPKLEGIERRILLDNGTRHDKFEAGELDITDVDMATYRADENDPELKSLLKTFERPAVFYLALNQKAYSPFADRRVRQAFARAVDRQEIVSTVHESVPRIAYGAIPFGVPGFDPSFRGIGFDPEAARKLLAEAGYPGGQGLPPLTLSFRAKVEDIKNTAVAVADQLEKNLGVKVTLNEEEWGIFLDKRNKGEMPFYFLRWMADYLDPQNFLSTMLRTGSPENSLGYSNPEFDRLCDAADVMQDQEKRFATYRQAEKLAIVDDVPWIPIYFQKDVELWNPKLKGVEDMLMGHLPHKRSYFEDQ